MTEPTVSTCQCPGCQSANEYAERRHHQQMNLLLSRLSEPQRRWYAALEANRLGYGGDRLVAQVTGLDEETIRRGRAELAEVPVTRQRRPGAGRPPAEKN